MGRNTGNRVSNAIFGDKWATPYRVAVNRDNRDSDNTPSGRSTSRGSRRNGRSRGNHSVSHASSSPRRSSGRTLYWLAGIVLFCGTYNAIINPNKEDIVLLLMLWAVAIAWFVIRLRTSRS
ncbi:MAG: hypothetical protein NC187_04735 [Candidatus Amulumruptor caecigallinarius]|nr:hypothetical protein [Candidatus Amulumruptor caecigallinarius]MCM1396778.1 hypothetical protein [Candidatus Amulumruptor caecigallinarius]MCM1454527.1 hypothetical protein [bacterium]